jgi:UDP-N-acetyl-D-mannosaminuronic acid transferase (WecB/TagA/CpsF family)
MGLPVRSPSPARLVDALVRMGMNRGTYALAAYLNAHVCNLAASDRALRSILASADLLYADGMAVVWANRLVNGRGGSRASAAHFLELFCWAAAGRGLKLAFVGGAKGVAASAAKALTSEIPSLKIVAVEHGYFDAVGGARIAGAPACRATRRDPLRHGIAASGAGGRASASRAGSPARLVRRRAV